MPSNTTRNTVLRQWELLKLLPSRGPGKTATELARALQEADFGVSKRQVERDLADLSDAFPALACNNAGVPYGWHWIPGAAVDLPGLTLAEALSLSLIEDTLKPLLPKPVLEALVPRFKQAQTRLNTLQATNRTARWARKVRTVAPGLPLLPPKVDAVALAELQEALLADEQVRARYRSAGDNAARELQLHPLGLVQRGPVTYLIATAFAYDDPRLYAVHRFTKVERTGERSKPLENFDLDVYLASGALQFGANGPIRLRAKISDDLAGILAETPLATDQKIEAGKGGNVVTATLPDSQQLRWWLLSQGRGVEVLEPTALRQELQEEIKGMAARYASR